VLPVEFLKHTKQKFELKKSKLKNQILKGKNPWVPSKEFSQFGLAVWPDKLLCICIIFPQGPD